MASEVPTDSTTPTRVCIVQQIVPHYRVPVFDLLARQPGIELSVWSDLHTNQGSLKPAKGSGAYEEVHAPLRKIGPMYWQPAQIDAAKSGRFDVIIFSWNARLAHLSRALRIARQRCVRTLLWGHGFSKRELGSAVGGGGWRRRLRNRLLRRADGCLLYNHAAAERLITDGFERERIFVALNAIDQTPIRAAREHWLARPNELADFRTQHAIANQDLIAFISRLEADKRIDLLLDAFAIVARQRPSAKLAIIGRGEQETALRNHAASLGLNDNTIFAGPIYDEMQLAPWFLSAACMAYPVAIGLSVLHAFGYGLPVVTSDDIASHNPEIEALRDGENGLLYRDGDVGDFAAKMLMCMNDATQRERMSATALATVREPDGFCIERMVRGFVEAIRFARANKSTSPQVHKST